jgi:hypothetical protein
MDKKIMKKRIKIHETGTRFAAFKLEIDAEWNSAVKIFGT